MVRLFVSPRFVGSSSSVRFFACILVFSSHPCCRVRACFPSTGAIGPLPPQLACRALDDANRNWKTEEGIDCVCGGESPFSMRKMAVWQISMPFWRDTRPGWVPDSPKGQSAPVPCTTCPASTRAVQASRCRGRPAATLQPGSRTRNVVAAPRAGPRGPESPLENPFLPEYTPFCLQGREEWM